MEKKYKINPPVGSVVLPREVMTEKELREFLPQLVMDPKQSDTWKEKAIKDPIEDLVEWLRQAGYEIIEQ